MFWVKSHLSESNLSKKFSILNQMDTFGNWLRLSAKSLLSKTEKKSDNLSPVNPLPMSPLPTAHSYDYCGQGLSINKYWYQLIPLWASRFTPICTSTCLSPGPCGIPGYPGILGLNSNPGPGILENIIPGFFGIYHIKQNHDFKDFNWFLNQIFQKKIQG